jgi:hypothetical protein
VPENNVTRIIAGTRIVISPENGYGDVTISVNDNALIWLENHENRIKKIEDNTYVNWLIAGDRINLSDNKGTVTISVNDNALVWLENLDNRISIIEGNYLNKHTDNYVQRLIAGPNITLNPENGLGIVTITSTAGGGNWILVEEKTVTAQVTYVDFLNLDINSHGAYLLLVNGTLNGPDYFYMYINDDYTSTNYYTQRLYASGTTTSAARVNVPEIGYVMSNGVGTYGTVFIARDVGGYVRWISQLSTYSAAQTIVWMDAGVSVNSFTNVTKIRVKSDSYIKVGSKFLLFRAK